MKKIFVSNLDFGATEASIRSLFEPYGTVESVHTVRRSGRTVVGLPANCVRSGESLLMMPFFALS